MFYDPFLQKSHAQPVMRASARTASNQDVGAMPSAAGSAQEPPFQCKPLAELPTP